MSVYAAPDAVGGMPGLGGPGMADPSGPPPAPGGEGSMAALAAALQGAGGGGGINAGAGLMDPSAGGGGLPPGLDPSMLGGDPGGGDPLAGLGGGGDPGAGGDGGGSDLLSGMGATDHIRAAIKHLMMAMTESGDDQESHGITKGMSVLHGILAGHAKNQKTIQAAGG